MSKLTMPFWEIWLRQLVILEDQYATAAIAELDRLRAEKCAALDSSIESCRQLKAERVAREQAEAAGVALLDRAKKLEAVASEIESVCNVARAELAVPGYRTWPHTIIFGQTVEKWDRIFAALAAPDAEGTDR